VNDVVKPLQESVIKQAELIKQQSTTIDKHVVKLTQHEHTVNKQDEHIKTLQQTVTDLKGNITDLQNNLSDLDIRLEDQEQYSRRTSLRFHNIPCGDIRNLYKMNTDQIILDICNDVLKVQITIKLSSSMIFRLLGVRFSVINTLSLWFFKLRLALNTKFL
jgi:prefoldin subunit 5